MTTGRLGLIRAALLALAVCTTASVPAATASRRAADTSRQPARRGPAPGRRGEGRSHSSRQGHPPVTTAAMPSPHPETTDPEIAKALAAFGAQNYDRARSIAEEVLKKPDRGGRRSEALDVIVESWLQQGEFGKARAAATTYSKQAPKASRDALVRVNTEEKSYRDDLKQLEERKRKARKPENRAHLQLLIGHTHRKVGHLAEAEKAYRAVIAGYPKSEAAGMAKRQLATLHPKPRSKK